MRLGHWQVHAAAIATHTVDDTQKGVPPDSTAHTPLAETANRSLRDGPSSGTNTTQTLTVLLHALQELDDNLGGRADQHLALATLLSVGHRLQGIGQNAHAHHLDCGGARTHTHSIEAHPHDHI